MVDCEEESEAANKTQTNKEDAMHACSFPGCSVSGPAEAMFNIARKETGGKLVILCRRHVLGARRNRLTVYRLHRTLELDRKRDEERVRAGTFFEAFKKANGNP